MEANRQLDRITEVWALTPPSTTRETAEVLRAVTFARDVIGATSNYTRILHLWGAVLNKLEGLWGKQKKTPARVKYARRVYDEVLSEEDELLKKRNCTERQFLSIVNFHSAWAIGQTLSICDQIEKLAGRQ